MYIDISGIEDFDNIAHDEIVATIENVLNNSDLDEYSISVNLIDSQTMKQLNFQFKKKNKVTDVLSFPLPEMERLFEHSKHMLGDIVICIEQAQKQANLFGHSLREEIAVLCAHGLFHLLGYDHEISEDEASIQMQGEMYLLEKAGFMPELSLIGRV